METLRTDRLELRGPDPGDIPAITEACQDPEIQHWTIIPSPYHRSDAEGFIEMVRAGWASGLSPTWALREAGALVGMIGLADEGAGSAELGFWLAPNGRGRGLMDEAAAAVCSYGFGAMGLARISWRAFVGNTGSAAIARRAGFRYEGLTRLGGTQRGVRRDQWIAGRLAADGDLTPELIQAAAATWPVGD